MLIFNLKLNKKNIFRTCLIIMFIICICIAIISLYKVLHSYKTSNTNLVDDSIPSNNIAELTAENYTNILNIVHKDIDAYIGQKISFSGYIYQSLIVGFLCSSEEASNFEMYSWVKIIGEITKGTYNNTDIPIIKITSIEKATKPENPNVMPPDDSFVPTAVIY